MEPIIVHFQLTEKDYFRAFQLFFHRKVNFYVLQAIYLVISLVVVIFLTIWSGRIYNDPVDFLPIVLVMLVFVAYENYRMDDSRQRIRKNKEFTLPGTFEIGEEEIVFRNELTKIMNSWGMFQATYENSEYFYFIFTRDAKAYMFLPKRSFTSPEQLEQVRALCKQKIRAVAARW